MSQSILIKIKIKMNILNANMNYINIWLHFNIQLRSLIPAIFQINRLIYFTYKILFNNKPTLKKGNYRSDLCRCLLLSLNWTILGQ